MPTAAAALFTSYPSPLRPPPTPPARGTPGIVSPLLAARVPLLREQPPEYEVIVFPVSI